MSEIQKFKKDEYKLCHVKMSTEGIYLVCTYPKEQEKQLQDDIQHAIQDTVQLISPPEQGMILIYSINSLACGSMSSCFEENLTPGHNLRAMIPLDGR